MPSRVEHRILADIRRGRRRACEQIARLHYRSIYNFLAYLSADPALAEDLTQETFAAAWAAIDGYRAEGSLGAWLHRIAYHKFVDAARIGRRRDVALADLESRKDTASQASDPSSRLVARERQGLLYEALGRLDEPEYTAIVLHYIQGFSFRRMARVLDEPVGTVKWRTNHALKNLRQLMTGRIQP